VQSQKRPLKAQTRRYLLVVRSISGCWSAKSQSFFSAAVLAVRYTYACPGLEGERSIFSKGTLPQVSGPTGTVSYPLLKSAASPSVIVGNVSYPKALTLEHSADRTRGNNFLHTDFDRRLSYVDCAMICTLEESKLSDGKAVCQNSRPESPSVFLHGR
jgi:hypothetical protein